MRGHQLGVVWSWNERGRWQYGVFKVAPTARGDELLTLAKGGLLQGR